ncbi:Retrovirus-related Pol polyprotein from transposon 17.6 [Stylophora pistillata]|uniref:Retrovirus-related Pol polyprotein from transposon 17.6 n=1 Tax=Stylophora pistillata TaxID=50429 RepID=A0A2B4RDS1_STYPI|nr:Retrovirus-related Pol polyprotein from transposon 17.6 [Stylophora pistillata]
MFKCSQVPFIGHLLTSEGLKNMKVEAICNMPKPEDVQAIQRFVNAVKYLSRFLEDLSDMSEPLRRLTHKGAPWKWPHEQEEREAFTKIEKAVSTAPVLKFFTPNEPVDGEGDASEKGIGVALMQEGQPVTYASRSLTKAKQNYSQIEKELLAEVFGMEHNHQYVYGRKVTLWTDHKPLEIIAKKPLAAAPKRLQRLMMRLTQYDVEIKYRRDPEMYLADTLSRAYLPQEHHPEKADQEVERIHSVNFLSISEPQIQEILEETAKEPVLQTLKATIPNGWPSQRKELPPELHEYFKVKDELATQDDIIFKGPKCVIPKSLRLKIKEKLHQSHIGIQGLPVYFSDYFEIDELHKSKTGGTVIGKLKKRFATHGIPDTFHSDNGPPFSSNWRNTPTEGMKSSPAQRMFSRRTRTLLPTSKKLLKPQLVTDVRERKLQRKEDQTRYYNQNVKELSSLVKGNVVRMKPQASDGKQRWTKAGLIRPGMVGKQPTHSQHQACETPPPQHSDPVGCFRMQCQAKPDAADCKLDSEVFQVPNQSFGPFTIDLFANKNNAQLERFYSYLPDPRAEQFDAPVQPWREENAYAFPPFNLISKCLKKISLEGATLLIVCLVWPAQAWYPYLLQLLTSNPVLLPSHNNLLLDPLGNRHPLIINNSPPLAGWRVSGITSLQKAYQKKLQIFSSLPNADQ